MHSATEATPSFQLSKANGSRRDDALLVTHGGGRSIDGETRVLLVNRPSSTGVGPQAGPPQPASRYGRPATPDRMKSRKRDVVRHTRISGASTRVDRGATQCGADPRPTSARRVQSWAGSAPAPGAPHALVHPPTSPKGPSCAGPITRGEVAQARRTPQSASRSVGRGTETRVWRRSRPSAASPDVDALDHLGGDPSAAIFRTGTVLIQGPRVRSPSLARRAASSGTKA